MGPSRQRVVKGYASDKRRGDQVVRRGPTKMSLALSTYIGRGKYMLIGEARQICLEAERFKV